MSYGVFKKNPPKLDTHQYFCPNQMTNFLILGRSAK